MSSESSKTFKEDAKSEKGDKRRKRIKRKHARKPDRDINCTAESESSDSSESFKVSENSMFKRKFDSESDDGVTSKNMKKIVSFKSNNIAFVEELSHKRTKKQSVQTGFASSEAQSQSSSKESLSKKYFERCETKIPKSERKKDLNNHKIYVRKLVNSKYTYAGKREKTDNDWGQVHFCKFCKKIKSNISKHLRIHKHEPEVKAILKESKHMGSRKKYLERCGIA